MKIMKPMKKNNHLRAVRLILHPLRNKVKYKIVKTPRKRIQKANKKILSTNNRRMSSKIKKF